MNDTGDSDNELIDSLGRSISLKQNSYAIP